MAGHPADPDRAGGPPRRARGRRRRGAALAGAVPGAVVLLPPVLVVAGAALSGATGFAWYLTALAAIAVTWWPRYPWAAMIVGFFALWLFGRDDLLALDTVAGTVPGLWRMAALVLTVHLLLVGTALAAHVAWRSLVEAGVLLRGARTVLATQAIAQSVLLLVAWIVVLGTVVPYAVV